VLEDIVVGNNFDSGELVVVIMIMTLMTLIIYTSRTQIVPDISGKMGDGGKDSFS